MHCCHDDMEQLTNVCFGCRAEERRKGACAFSLTHRVKVIILSRTDERPIDQLIDRLGAMATASRRERVSCWSAAESCDTQGERVREGDKMELCSA